MLKRINRKAGVDPYTGRWIARSWKTEDEHFVEVTHELDRGKYHARVDEGKYVRDVSDLESVVAWVKRQLGA